MWEPTPPWFEGFAHFFERLAYEPGFHARYVPELPKEQRAQGGKMACQIGGVERCQRHCTNPSGAERLYEDPNSLEAITRFAAETRSALTGSAPAPKTEAGLTYDGASLSAIF